jgi:hypothetical protein
MAVCNTIEDASRQVWNIVVDKLPSGAIEYGTAGKGRVECDGWFVFGYRSTGSTSYERRAIEKAST